MGVIDDEIERMARDRYERSPGQVRARLEEKGFVVMADEEVEAEPEFAPEPVMKLDVARRTVVGIKASFDLGKGKRLSVSSTSVGVRITFSKRIKQGTWNSYTNSETVTIPDEFIGNLSEALVAVVAERDKK